MLDTLEAQIKEVTMSLKQDSIATRAQYLKSANDNANDHNIREDNHDNKNKNTRSLTELDNPNNWSVLNAIMALNDEEKIKVLIYCSLNLLFVLLTHFFVRRNKNYYLIRNKSLQKHWKNKEMK